MTKENFQTSRTIVRIYLSYLSFSRVEGHRMRSGSISSIEPMRGRQLFKLSLARSRKVRSRPRISILVAKKICELSVHQQKLGQVVGKLVEPAFHRLYAGCGRHVPLRFFGDDDFQLGRLACNTLVMPTASWQSTIIFTDPTLSYDVDKRKTNVLPVMRNSVITDLPGTF